MPSLTICKIQFTKWGHDTYTKKFCQDFVLIVRVDFEEERLDITENDIFTLIIHVNSSVVQ